VDYQWTIFQADLDPTIGHEQSGRRPVLVVSAEPVNDRYGSVTIVPITSRKDRKPARIGEVLVHAGTGGLPRESFIICHQVRTVDKSRLGKMYGVLADSNIQRQVIDALALCLDIY
jgi:mRNA interferase MazF